MSEDMGADDTRGPEGQEFPFPPTAVPGAPSEDGELVAARRRSPLTIVVAAFVAALVLMGSGIGIGWVLSRGTPGDGAVGRGSSRAAVASAADTAGIIDINTFTTRTGLHQGTDFPLGAGTGMVLTSSGEVLTNNHVIEGATRIEVTIPGRGSRYTADVVGADPAADVALLQIEGASGLPTVTFGDSSGVSVGDRVIAIGNALGRGGYPSVSTGSIWGLGQTIAVRGAQGEVGHLEGVIRVGAPVSPGDSGGPVENASGDVVGMITAADTHGGRTVSSVAYAIPARTALGIVRRIRTGEKSTAIVIGDAGYLGVQIKNLDAGTASRLGVPSDGGVLVVGVMPGSPAARTGMRGDSVITAIDGTAVTSAGSLGLAIHSHSPGEWIRVTWVDSSGTHTARATLVAGPAV
jgi:S1-C subfamily serine protease